MLLVEEGQPDYIEQNLNTILRRAGSDVALHGKDMLPVAGEYTSAAVTRGLAAFLRPVPCPTLIEPRAGAAARRRRPGKPVRRAGRRRRRAAAPARASAPAARSGRSSAA